MDLLIQSFIVVLGFLATAYVAHRGFRSSVEASNEQARSNRISTHRQEWIDRLRLTVAECISCIVEWSHHESQLEHLPALKPKLEQEAKEAVTRLRARWLMLRYELELRINSKEPDHQHLVQSLDTLWRSRRDTEYIGSPQVAEVVTTSQAILKREWERVKAGERSPTEHLGEGSMDEQERDRQETRRNLQTTRRDEMMIHSVRGLLIANGGGAVALLLFLPNIAKVDIRLSLYIVGAQCFMAIGVVLAGLVLLIRYETTIREQGKEPNWRRWSRAYRFTALISLLMFLAGAVVVTVGAFIVYGAKF